MDLPDLGILALVEGVADIVPIDGSAHAMIVSRLLGLRANGLAPAFHLGAAFALALYFWRDMALISSGLWKLRKARIEVEAIDLWEFGKAGVAPSALALALKRS